jgi:hypothetical protein
VPKWTGFLVAALVLVAVTVGGARLAGGEGGVGAGGTGIVLAGGEGGVGAGGSGLT